MASVLNQFALDKSALRRLFADRRRNFAADSARRQQAEEKIQRHLSSLPVVSAENLGASYRSVSAEASLHNLHVQLWRGGQRLAFPVVENRAMAFFIPQSYEDLNAWRSGAWGIPEPNPDTAHSVDLRTVPFVFVPGVAFDTEGRRLGQGQGFYDQSLVQYSGVKIGVGFAVQLSQQPLPSEPHDVVMDYVVTDEAVLKIR